jgi:hypothetical protein
MPETITNEDPHYAFDLVKAICTEVSLGLPGTPQEAERAEMIKKEFESYLGAENVVLEEFTVAPGALVGSLPMSGLLTLLADPCSGCYLCSRLQLSWCRDGRRMGSSAHPEHLAKSGTRDHLEFTHDRLCFLRRLN